MELVTAIKTPPPAHMVLFCLKTENGSTQPLANAVRLEESFNQVLHIHTMSGLAVSKRSLSCSCFLKRLLALKHRMLVQRSLGVVLGVVFKFDHFSLLHNALATESLCIVTFQTT